MKHPLLIVLLLSSLLFMGCGRQQPIAEGTPLSGIVWEFPRERLASNSGTPIAKECRVAVYPTLIVITAPDKTRRIVPLSEVSDLQLK